MGKASYLDSTRSTMPNDEEGVANAVFKGNANRDAGLFTTDTPPAPKPAPTAPQAGATPQSTGGGASVQIDKSKPSGLRGVPKGQAVMTNAGWQMDGVDMAPDQMASYFGKSRAALAAGQGPLSEGIHMPIGGQVMNVTQAGLPSNFTGQPTMYPVQQSVGQDIFGDTADLFKRRDSLQSQMDAFYAKNPLSDTDIAGNFQKIASMAGHRNQIKELGETLRNRDTIMGGVMGHMMGAQATTGAAGIRANADVESAKIMAGAGSRGKAEDPMKGPMSFMDSLTKLASNPEALASMPPEYQAELKKLLPTLTGHLKRGYGIGLGAEVGHEEDLKY